MILRFENGCDQFAGCRNLALAHPVKGGFAMVGEGGKRLEPEHCPGPLQCMQSAENGVDLILIGQIVKQIEKATLDLLEKLRSLRSENLNRVQRRHFPRTFLTILTRCSASKGLVSQPVAPAALARAFMSASDSVVRKMIGMPV